VDPAVDLALRLALALLFLGAAATKTRDLGAFRAAVADYRLLPERAAPALAAALVAAEVVVGIALALGPRAPAALAAASLLALYGGAIAVNLARGRRDLGCGCGGPAARQPISGGLVARNAALATAALAGLLSTATRALVWIDALTVVGTVAALAALYAATNALIAQAPALARTGRSR
jgi:hypothetical protein